jgi:hypothetical protein
MKNPGRRGRWRERAQRDVELLHASRIGHCTVEWWTMVSRGCAGPNRVERRHGPTRARLRCDSRLPRARCLACAPVERQHRQEDECQIAAAPDSRHPVLRLHNGHARSHCGALHLRHAYGTQEWRTRFPLVRSTDARCVWRALPCGILSIGVLATGQRA